MRLEINKPKSFKISSRKPWNETGIEIRAGERYEFIADGTWWDLIYRADADGFTNSYMQRFDKSKRSEENLWLALIGSLDKSKSFLIGKQQQITFEEDGILCCYANDLEHFYWNNFGRLDLKITRIQ
jgi:hypothetical protein